MNVVNFQFSNITKNATSGMTRSVSTVMTVIVIECTRVSVVLIVIVTVPSKLFLLDRFFQNCHCRKWFARDMSPK